MEDPFLNYFSLGLLFVLVIVLVHGIIAIHDVPARIAKLRHRPHTEVTAGFRFAGRAGRRKGQAHDT